MNKGKIVQIIGPVVDAEFTEQLPAIYNALTVEYELEGESAKLTLEVQQHLGDNWVRAVAMSSTEGLKRFKPSVELMATARTQLSPRCCCTSSVSLADSPSNSYSTVSAL